MYNITTLMETTVHSMVTIESILPVQSFKHDSQIISDKFDCKTSFDNCSFINHVISCHAYILLAGGGYAGSVTDGEAAGGGATTAGA